MNKSFQAALGLLMVLALVIWAGIKASVDDGFVVNDNPSSTSRRVLGSVVKVNESASQLQFLARVDTGAKVCSLHTSEATVLDGSSDLFENVGKTLRFLLENRQGESQWVERLIAEVREIRTSEGEEVRYLIAMKLTCSGVEREVLVSLNDRSRMSYSMLLGRNYLDGQFVVDVTGADDEPSLLLSQR